MPPFYSELSLTVTTALFGDLIFGKHYVLRCTKSCRVHGAGSTIYGIDFLRSRARKGEIRNFFTIHVYMRGNHFEPATGLHLKVLSSKFLEGSRLGLFDPCW
jgi:hypothetical protein